MPRAPMWGTHSRWEINEVSSEVVGRPLAPFMPAIFNLARTFEVSRSELLG